MLRIMNSFSTDEQTSSADEDCQKLQKKQVSGPKVEIWVLTAAVCQGQKRSNMYNVLMTNAKKMVKIIDKNYC